MNTMTEQLEKEKAKCKELWRMSYEQLARHDKHLALKEEEIENLKARLSELEGDRPVRMSTVPQIPDRNLGCQL